MKKKIIVSLLLILTLLSFSILSYGFSVEDLKGDYKEVETIKTAGNNVVKIISAVGVVVSVVALMLLGIKYMMGSVEEKAEYKKTLMPYVIGACLVFGASTIAQLVYELAIKLKV